MSGTFKTDLLTRVEGHGSVELIVDKGLVVDARLHLFESPRLFEALLVGRRYDEIADIACRICSICSTVHKVAALQAVEYAVGITVSRQTGLLRELAVQGGQIESHALHIFCLALPDYIGGHGFPELALCQPEMLLAGLRIKKLGNLIQEIVGGRAIHPFNLLLGGIGRVPDASQLELIGEQLVAREADLAASRRYLSSLPELLPLLPVQQSCAVSGGPPLFGDHLVTSTAAAIPAAHAAAWLNEHIEPHTHAKVSRFDETTPFVVGPVARLGIALPPGFADECTELSIGSSLKARIIELQLAVERAKVLTAQLLADGLKQEPPVSAGALAGEGSALIEAPRGVLLHRYSFDEQGICRTANIMTPTAINQRAMAASLKDLVVAMDGAEYARIKKSAEILLRCYDPCISCAVH